ncbi:MAG: GTP 3',8-cyclase MoaA [bacterium]
MTLPQSPARDALSRPLHDLRISVIDRCNFRCTYCMPKSKFGHDHQFLKRAELLSNEQIVSISKTAVALGVKKIRLTGGEPLLRKGLHHLVYALKQIDGLEDLSLTTNAIILTKKNARLLKAAGLDRVNISLDALDDATFMQINDMGMSVHRVMEGIQNAADVGLAPVKVNMVVQKGLNEHSLLPMARHFHGTGHILRFIEYMDVGQTNGWQKKEVLTAKEMINLINADMPIEPVDPDYQGEVAKRWRYLDGGGEIGFVSSISQPFCRDCGRARVSAEGKLYTCLFAGHGYDLKPHMDKPESLKKYMGDIWAQRQDRYSETRTQVSILKPKIEMSYIGG